ncbi:MAG: hypothetical protein QOD61_1423 [Solirubrobacteraceae bacterium]|nr:hypothetical protein [Solirubrobacteraceae bacterium]
MATPAPPAHGDGAPAELVVSRRALRRVSIGTAWFALAVAAVVLLGWILGDETLKRIVPFHREVSMKTNTAVALGLTGLGLWLSQLEKPGRAGARICAAAVMAIGAATLVEYTLGVNLGIDQLLFHEPFGVVHTSSPNRMAANTAFCFVALGLALVLVGRRAGKWCPTSVLALIVAAIAGLALIGIGMGVTAIPGVSQQARMALMTAITFVVLAVGCGCASPDSASVRRFFSAGSGGLTVRRLLPVAFVLPVALGSVRLAGEQAGVFGAEVGTWLLIVAMIICIGGVVWQLSGSIERGDRELRQAEHDLRRAVAEAERASDAKSQFLSAMSHELRTPLNAILGFGQLLEFDELDAEQHESAHHIVEAGRHLLGLVNEVLDIARIESGKLTVSVEPVALGPVLEEVGALIGPLGRERGITVEIDRGAGEPWRLLADRQRLQQIFINLLSNAIKYNHAGGWVRLYCEPGAGETLAIVVADGGPGIDASDQERMFEPFERIGEHAAEGTGLGLALARHLAELMGGSLAVDSQPGAGARFILTLPLSVSGPADLPPRSSAAVAIGPMPAGASGDVLYVEDNPANIALVESVCARVPGLRLRTAATGRGGLDAARSRPPDLILLDLHLPDLGGEDVLRALRSRPATARTPVLILTADATSGEKARLLAAGADGYLTKPLDVHELQAEILRLLAASGPESGSVPGPPAPAPSGRAAVIPA